MKRLFTGLLAAALLSATSCIKVLEEIVVVRDATYYTNVFAYNIMQVYYLWKDEVQDQIDDWNYKDDPIQKVQSLRYKEYGREVDKWTLLTDNYQSFLGSVTGNTRSLGMELLYTYGNEEKTLVHAIVAFTYADSPARKAGLQRGDRIVALDGQALTLKNYEELITQKILSPTSVRLSLSDGREVSLTAVQMYEDPVVVSRTLDLAGKRIGYLLFASFTEDCCKDLENAFRDFKADGIQELVLDLRYNGGGYTSTSLALASMIAPPEAVSAGKTFNTEVYNSYLAKKLDESSQFAPTLKVSGSQGDQTIEAGAVNPGVSKLWVIQTGRSASASEALICGLLPYMDVTLVGEKTYGKFCGGYLIGAQKWFNALADDGETQINCTEGARLCKDWGIYVMVSRYADCNGVTRSMPDGIAADYPAQDRPLDGYQLGDPEETMLSAVLALSAGKPLPADIAATKACPPEELPAPVLREGFGARILPRP